MKFPVMMSLLLAGTLCADAGASERKAYKIVDEKGNVTYSQTPPPAPARKVETINIAPANTGYGSNKPSSDLPRQPQHYNQSEYAERQQQHMRSQQKAREEAERQRVENLRAECSRNRGADCENPETLRLIEAQRIPGGRVFR